MNNGTALPHVSSPLAPGHCKDKTYPLYYLEMKSFSQLSLLPDSCGFLRETGSSPSRCCELSRLHCHGHSPHLSSYLCRIKRNQNSSRIACRHHLQVLTHLLDCPASQPLRRVIFGTTSILHLWALVV